MVRAIHDADYGSAVCAGRPQQAFLAPGTTPARDFRTQRLHCHESLESVEVRDPAAYDEIFGDLGQQPALLEAGS